MKPEVHIFEVTGSYISTAADFAVDTSRSRALSGSFAAVEEAVLSSQARRSSSAIHIVGVLAFTQSLIFLVIWLLICAAAGAATKPQAEFNPELKVSTYKTAKVRDPFARSGVAAPGGKASPSVPITLHLQGILYQPTNPSAIVNDKLLTLDKIVTLSAGNGEVQVKAVEIARDRVVLDVGGQKVELWLSQRGAAQ